MNDSSEQPLNTESIVGELAKAEQSLTSKEDQLVDELVVVRHDLKRVRGAKNCLVEKRASKSGRRAPTKAEVSKAIIAVLKEHGPQTEDNLRASVLMIMTKGGRSKQGFALRFKEAMRHEQLTITAEGISLKGTTDDKASKPSKENQNG